MIFVSLTLYVELQGGFNNIILNKVIISFGQSSISTTTEFFFGTVSDCPIEVVAYPDADLDSVKRKERLYKRLY